MVYEELCVRGATLERWSVTIRLKQVVLESYYPISRTLIRFTYGFTRVRVTPRLRHRAVLYK